MPMRIAARCKNHHSTTKHFLIHYIASSKAFETCYLLPGTRGRIAKMYGELRKLECESNSNTFRNATAARTDSVFSSAKLYLRSVLSLSNHKAVAVGLST